MLYTPREFHVNTTFRYAYVKDLMTEAIREDQHWLFVLSRVCGALGTTGDRLRILLEDWRCPVLYDFIKEMGTRNSCEDYVLTHHYGIGILEKEQFKARAGPGRVHLVWDVDKVRLEDFVLLKKNDGGYVDSRAVAG